MAIFYKGACIGSYWYRNDPRSIGLRPRASHLPADTSRLLYHVGRGTTHSPYISLTRSYNIAWDYAVETSKIRPTRRNPAYVYEIRLDPLPRGVTLIEPIIEIADAFRHLLGAMPYQHDGPRRFPIGIACDSVLHGLSRRLISMPYRQPPPGGGTVRPPNLAIELETIIRAVRDAEVLIVGIIPAACIVNRIDAYR